MLSSASPNQPGNEAGHAKPAGNEPAKRSGPHTIKKWKIRDHPARPHKWNAQLHMQLLPHWNEPNRSTTPHRTTTRHMIVKVTCWLVRRRSLDCALCTSHVVSTISTTTIRLSFNVCTYNRIDSLIQCLVPNIICSVIFLLYSCWSLLFPFYHH